MIYTQKKWEEWVGYEWNEVLIIRDDEHDISGAVGGVDRGGNWQWEHGKNEWWEHWCSRNRYMWWAGGADNITNVYRKKERKSSNLKQGISAGKENKGNWVKLDGVTWSKHVNWFDVGCGNRRCLARLEVTTHQTRTNNPSLLLASVGRFLDLLVRVLSNIQLAETWTSLRAVLWFQVNKNGGKLGTVRDWLIGPGY
jgi:hypothetical protein